MDWVHFKPKLLEFHAQKFKWVFSIGSAIYISMGNDTASGVTFFWKHLIHLCLLRCTHQHRDLHRELHMSRTQGHVEGESNGMTVVFG